MLRDPGKLLEGTGKYLRHIKLRRAADVRRPEVPLIRTEMPSFLNFRQPSGDFQDLRLERELNYAASCTSLRPKCPE